AHVQVAQRLYDNFYAKGLHRDLWFHWHGKPLMLAPSEGLSPQLRDFLTLRQSWAWTDPRGWFGDGRDKWPWLDNHPQNPGWHAGPQKPEELAVCVAQHPTSNIGRSFHAGHEPTPGERAPERGLCFEEQWRRALDVDPELVFVTGWNEWIAQRFLSDGSMTFCGHRLPQGETFFVDQYSQEYSRDIEPMRGGHGDDYYYQLVSWIRRFKGVRPRPKAVPLARPLAVGQDFSRWDGAGLTYLDDLGDTLHRDHLGWGDEHYVNTTGRNDFDTLQVAHDARHVYFHARCRAPLTPCTDPHWMLLLLDTDGDPANGWEGFDYVVNRSVVDPTTTVVEKCLGGWRWEPVGLVKMAVRANALQLAVPRAMLGLTAGPLRLDFQWADNVPDPPDILDFMDHGDTAPNGRFRYRYEE
ncbi:MAG: hypothetical protein HYU66_00885, partial [Armatimonadetes bacterium]|nr:hypothetical protein [Armatimonadota bacterium]